MASFETVRFGSLEVPDDERLEFNRGLLGFEKLRRFVHLEVEAEYPFGWLQSLEDPAIAFVVANPAVFFPDYKIEVDPRELGDVRPGANERLLVLGICTIPETFRDVTMNLQGPLVINEATRKGKQLVLNHSGYVTQHRLAEVHSGTHRTPELTRSVRAERTPA
jgi:flagellar assembly factor FliW